LTNKDCAWGEVLGNEVVSKTRNLVLAGFTIWLIFAYPLSRKLIFVCRPISEVPIKTTTSE